MKTGTVVDCKNGHVFRLGLTDDGFRDCPDCGELLSNPKQGANTFGMLTIGQAWRNKRKAESNDKPKQSISIAVDANTDKLQLKLRAIAKHAEQLANELDAIDNEWQCEYCGHDEYVVYRIKGYDKLCKCAKCDEKCVVPNDSLPTGLEGSE